MQQGQIQARRLGGQGCRKEFFKVEEGGVVVVNGIFQKGCNCTDLIPYILYRKCMILPPKNKTKKHKKKEGWGMRGVGGGSFFLYFQIYILFEGDGA